MRLGLIIFLAFLVVLPGFAEESEDWYLNKPIRRIFFEGLNNVRASELEGIIEPYIGREFTDDLFWELLGRLYSLEYFDEINPSAVRMGEDGNEAGIRFIVVERPVISRINFVGISGLRRSQLSDVISLSVNDVATPAKLRMDEIAIINRYIEGGFPDVRVRSETVSGANSSVIVNFHIEEGEKIVIDDILFEGISVFSARTLRRQISLKTRGIVRDGAFQEAQLILDRQTITQYYHDRGYIDAHVVDVAREIRQDDKGNNLMVITFMVYEGREYTFGGITFEGNLIFSDELLGSQVSSKVGERVNDRRIQADLMRITDVYLENGYIFNRIDPIPNRNVEEGILSYNILIIERGRAHIENITVVGNVKTRDSVILREIPLVPGDIFSKARIMTGLTNLYNLQFFSAVTPETPPGSADALMELVISVEEQPTTDVQFGLTFSGSADPDTFPISAMARWNDRNFRGTGNSLWADLNISPDTQAVSTGFTQRWFLGMPFSMSYDVSFQHMNRRSAMDNIPPFFHGDEEEAYPDGFSSFDEFLESSRMPSDSYIMPYHQYRLSFGVSSGYRWFTFLGNLGLNGGIRIGWILNTFDNELYRPFDPVLRAGNNRWRPSTSIWTSLSLDRRDVFFDPTRGYYGMQRFGWYGIAPTEHEHYIRTDTRLEWFHTLFPLPVAENWSLKAIFGIHTGFSFIFPQPNRGPFPLIEEANQLAVDGMFIGRGWSSEYRNKGMALWTNWAEIRIPLAPGILAWDFFLDAAGVRNTPRALFSDFFEDDGSRPGHDTFFMRFSYGGGFRFTMPQFPFRFSFARRFWIENNTIRQARGGFAGFDFVVSFAMSTY